MQFDAAVLTGQNQPLEIHTLEVPRLRFGQVLVKVICSGVCGSQLGEIAGAKGPDPWIPHLLGHEGCGEVLECGEGVSTVKPSDRVVMHWRPGAGLQGPSPAYQSQSLGKVNAGWVTTFNELAVVSENRVTTVPDELDPEHAALMGCAITTGLGVINNNAKVKIGESVVVWGAGGIGLNMIQGAAMVSAYPIIAIDLIDAKLDLARELGATHTFNSKDIEPTDGIRDVVGGGGADVVIDNTGNPGVIRSCYDLTQPSGRTVLVGVPPKGKETTLYTLPLHFEKLITGSHGGEARPEIDIPKYVTLARAGKIHIKPFLTNRYGFCRINEAVTDLKEGQVTGRCIINF
jgi:S-(hydroxymethyl)glutathione dehydrogenase/alcohol dehydrogenase